MITTALVLLTVLAVAVYLAPLPVLGTVGALGVLLYPTAAAVLVVTGAVVAITAAALVIGRELRATGPALIWTRS